jgi:hypothetical protein
VSDKVRVLRLIEYSGPRQQVEDQLNRSMRDGTHGPGRFNTTDPKREGVTIKIATLGDFPELLERAEQNPVGTVRALEYYDGSHHQTQADIAVEAAAMSNAYDPI